MRLLSAWAAAGLVFSAVPPAGRAGKSSTSEVRADVAQPGEDLSAHRIDSEVFGWSADFKEVGVVASDVTRGRLGEHRGEVFMLIFDVGSLTPKQNVQVHFLTQAALPHDPIPLDPISSWLWTIDHMYKKMWPKRPSKKRAPGAMAVTPLWEIGELGEGLCQPQLGFALEWKKEKRYQPHQPLALRASCERMRYTDHRLYWAKKDLAALMIRFDHGAPRNEQSVRFVVSAAWELGRPVRLLLRGPRGKHAPMSDAAARLAAYGALRREEGPDGAGWRISAAPELVSLAARIAAELGGQLETKPLPAGIELLIERADPPPPPRQPRDAPPPEPACGGLLRDCDN